MRDGVTALKWSAGVLRCGGSGGSQEKNLKNVGLQKTFHNSLVPLPTGEFTHAGNTAHKPHGRRFKSTPALLPTKPTQERNDKGDKRGQDLVTIIHFCPNTFCKQPWKHKVWTKAQPSYLRALQRLHSGENPQKQCEPFSKESTLSNRG